MAVPPPERLKVIRWVLGEERRAAPYISKSPDQTPNGKPTRIRFNFSSMVAGSNPHAAMSSKGRIKFFSWGRRTVRWDLGWPWWPWEEMPTVI